MQFTYTGFKKKKLVCGGMHTHTFTYGSTSKSKWSKILLLEKILGWDIKDSLYCFYFAAFYK